MPRAVKAAGAEGSGEHKMRRERFAGAAAIAAAALLGPVLPGCKNIPEDATFAQPEKPDIYYEEPTAAQECQDEDAGGPECPDEPIGPVVQPERVE